MYRVTYDSVTRPTDLPEGAKVEQIAREFPFEMRVLLDRCVGVEKIGICGRDVFLHVDAGSAYLTADEVRELVGALRELIGDDDATDTPPTLVRDGDDDYWRLDTRNGRYIMTGSSTYEPSSYEDGTHDLARIDREYSGYTVIS